MPANETLPATDSATDLHRILGDDATATFEDDPNFVDSNPTGNASSENVEEQRSAAGSTTPSAKSTDDADEDEDEDDDVDEEEDLDDEDDDDDEDVDDEDDDEDDLDDDSEDDDDVDDEDDDEDDADEVNASSVLRADGLLGYEDEAEDVKNGVDRKKGDRERAEAEEDLKDGEKNYDPYSHEDGKWEPRERETPEAEGALIQDRNDDPNFIPPYKAAAQNAHNNFQASTR